MDEALKKDIAKEYLSEYYQAEKSRLTGFWKRLDQVLSSGVTVLRTRLDTPSLWLIGSLVTMAASVPAGIAAFGALVVSLGFGVYSNGRCRDRASEAVQRDIDNGVLPERYNDVLESRLKNLGEQVDLCTAQKAQLPPKGSVTKAFSAAVAGETGNEPAAPAPAAAVEAPKP